MRPSRPVVIWLMASFCWLSAAFLIITGLLTNYGIVPLRSGAFLLEGLELMGPLVFFLVAEASAFIGFALILRWPDARRLAILLFAIFRFCSDSVHFFCNRRIPMVRHRNRRCKTAVVRSRDLLPHAARRR